MNKKTVALCFLSAIAAQAIPKAWAALSAGRVIPIGHAIFIGMALALLGMLTGTVLTIAFAGSWVDRWFKCLATKLTGVEANQMQLDSLRVLVERLIDSLGGGDPYNIDKIKDLVVMGVAEALNNSHAKGFIGPGACRYCGRVPEPNTDALGRANHDTQCVLASLAILMPMLGNSAGAMAEVPKN